VVSSAHLACAGGHAATLVVNFALGRSMAVLHVSLLFEPTH